MHGAGAHSGRVDRALSTGQRLLYCRGMLTLSSRVDVMSRLGRAMADTTRARILLHLLDSPGYPGVLATDLGLTRSNVSNHLACLRGCGIVVAVPEGRSTRYEIADPHLTRALTALVDVVLAVDDGRPCDDAACDSPLCCGVDA
jgi:DNA-binding transcriptional ArsR family regulator